MNNSLALVIKRNEFYQRGYRSTLIINLVLLLIILLLVAFAYYQSREFAIPKYFPTTADGVVINSPPNSINHLSLTNLHFNEQGELLEWPAISASDLDLQAEDSNQHAILKLWVSRAIIAIFNLDYINYRAVLQEVRQYFTPKGYDKFLEALDNSKNLDTIKKGKRVAYATLNGKAKVASVGMLENRVVWNVTVPITVTYESNVQETLTQELLADVKVARVSTLQTPFYGVAIYQINFKMLR